MIDWHDPDGRPDRDVTPLSVSRWVVAAVIVFAAHGSAAWMALNWKPAVAAGEPPPAVLIELAPVAVAPDAPPQEVAPGPQMAEAQPELAPEVPLKPLKELADTPDPVVEEVKKPIEDARPLGEPQPDVEVPKLPENPTAEAVLAPALPQPKVEKKPPPKIRKAERKKPVDPAKPRAPQTTAPPTSQAQRADTAAAPFASAVQAPSMSPASWRGALNAHLERYKRFPGGAAGAGIAQIAFTIDRSGRVLSSRLIRSSGDPALDEEAASLPRRASPVPPPPPDTGGAVLTLAVPVRFSP